MTGRLGVAWCCSLALLSLSCSAAAAPPTTESYCKRLPVEDMPPSLEGRYDVVGKDFPGDSLYSGTIEVKLGESSYSLVRAIRGRSIHGAAWLEACGPDRFQRLMVRWDSRPRTIEYSCYLAGDGDNFIRASCTTADGHGLEAWFQRHDFLAP